MKRYKKGFTGADAGAIVTLIIGFGIATLVMIFVSVLGASAWEQTQDDVAAITDGNVKASVTSSVRNAFDSLDTLGGLMPLLALAFVMIIIIAMVLSMGGGGRSYGGGL